MCPYKFYFSINLVTQRLGDFYFHVSRVSARIFLLVDLLTYRLKDCVRDWSGILLERSGKRYSGKPDGVAGTPKTMYN